MLRRAALAGVLLLFVPLDGATQSITGTVSNQVGEVVDSVVVTLEGQIDDLSNRLQRQRARADFIGGVDRFGDRIDPTSGRIGRGAGVSVSDSTGAGGLPVSLEDRITALEETLLSLIRFRDDLVFRAGQFRERIGRRG